MFAIQHLLLVSLLSVSALADWTTQPWDAIIVGAGPAGIIGELNPMQKRTFG